MLTKDNFKVAADQIGCNLAAIQMFYSVESAGSGYLNEPGKDPRLKILFEGHQFWKQVEAAGQDPIEVLKRYPSMANILYKNWTHKFYQGGAAEWTRMSKALVLCKDIGIKDICALNSASYGAFQLMGFNAYLAGYVDAKEMINGFNSGGEVEQLQAFINYIKAVKLSDELQLLQYAESPDVIRRICVELSKGYNGAGYKGSPFTDTDDYDIKLYKAYIKFSSN